MFRAQRILGHLYPIQLPPDFKPKKDSLTLPKLDPKDDRDKTVHEASVNAPKKAPLNPKDAQELLKSKA